MPRTGLRVPAERTTAVVEVLLAQSAYVRVMGEERGSGPAQPAHCARLDLATDASGEWRLARSSPCE